MKIQYKWGTIEGKRQRLWTTIGWCKTCNIPFEKINVRRKIYCDICSLNSGLQNRRRYESNREERNEYIRQAMEKGRGNGTINTNLSGTTSRVCGKPPEEPSDKDWMEYHNKIKKMKKDTMGGYQDYHDIDDDYNPYE